MFWFFFFIVNVLFVQVWFWCFSRVFEGRWCWNSYRTFCSVGIATLLGHVLSNISGSVYQIMECVGIFRTDWFASLQFTENIHQFSCINSPVDRVYYFEFLLCIAFLLEHIGVWDYLPLALEAFYLQTSVLYGCFLKLACSMKVENILL